MHVTRNVDPQDVTDLGTNPPRACLAVIRGGRTRLLPGRATTVGDGYQVSIRREDARGLDGANALLVVDDGIAWFELRAITVRGTLTAMATGTEATGQPGTAGRPATDTAQAPTTVPFLLTPRRVIAWDYGALRPSADPVAAPEGRAAG
jgi:hypothetical protein